MPIKIARDLPVKVALERERVVTIDEIRARKQDIRPLKIAILNLMPKKQDTELQMLRLLGNTPLQIEVDLLYTASHESSHTAFSHLDQFYKTFDQVKEDQYDGLIITGAPVEKLEFDDVNYIDELDQIFDWAQENVYSRFYICWGAQYAMKRLYNIDKQLLDQKLFGVYPYRNRQPLHPLVRGFDEVYRVPQSRHTTLAQEEIEQVEDLLILTSHPEYGPDIVASKGQRDFFIFGHLEYDRQTLKAEYDRDRSQGLAIDVPVNYYPDDDPSQEPLFDWRSHAFLLYNNWINLTYQDTFYDLKTLIKGADQ
ncbi:homoserine O-succinyltransferase [Hutsoniella sourekii]|uniref:homoserine O-succinyltransferase n=1 Tax=Hutsoniella sourekii TaxID=87650 RepID=UPI000483F747|nr:homoserine O-succinyltransferase [Hutsoniella sourekii]